MQRRLDVPNWVTKKCSMFCLFAETLLSGFTCYQSYIIWYSTLVKCKFICRHMNTLRLTWYMIRVVKKFLKFLKTILEAFEKPFWKLLKNFWWLCYHKKVGHQKYYMRRQIVSFKKIVNTFDHPDLISKKSSISKWNIAILPSSQLTYMDWFIETVINLFYKNILLC